MTTLAGIPIDTDPDAIVAPANLTTLAEELARVYGTDRVSGHYQPAIRILAPGPDMYGNHADARVGVCTALRYVAPITDTAEAIRLLRAQTPWVPSIAP